MTTDEIKDFEKQNRGRFFTARVRVGSGFKEFCAKDLRPVSDNWCAFRDVNHGFGRVHCPNADLTIR